MGWAKMGISGALLAAALSVGCQNKLYDQNKELMDENKALRDQNDQLRQKPAPAPQPPVTPAPAAVVPTLPTTPPPTTPTTPIAPPPTVEQIGGLETSVNARTGNTIVHLPSDVFFDPGQATLKSSAKTSLDKVVTALNRGKYASKGIRVEGHTDSTPIRVSKWASNQALSEARADAVKTYLVSKGIDTSRITIKGFGDTKPRSTSDISKNRRVEIVVLTGR